MTRTPGDRSAPERRSLAPILGAAAVALLLILGIGGAKSLRDLRSARDRSAAIEQKMTETRDRIGALEQRIARLQADPAELERVAREDLRLVRPGDRVMLLPDNESGGRP